MRIVSKVCQSGGKKMPSGRLINEDGLTTFSVEYNGKKYDFVVVMDGATGLGKDYEILNGHTSAEWYVSFMMREMQIAFDRDPLLDLEFVIDGCIEKVIQEIVAFERANNMTLEEYQKPSSALALLRTDGEVTDLYLIGDVQAIVTYLDGSVINVDNPNQVALQKLDHSVIHRMTELAKEKCCNVLDTRSDPEIEQMLKANRAKKNTDCVGGYWVCGTTPNTARHGVCNRFQNADMAGLVLATDGFDFAMLGLDEKQLYRVILKDGIEYTVNCIREMQEQDDLCNQFPRFKKGDDLTVVYADYR